MRRNIAKVSALIMAATTTMSPMMPAATTVAWADEVVAQAATGQVDSVSAQWDKVDWNAETVTVTVVYKFVGVDKEYKATATVDSYYWKDDAKCNDGNWAVATVSADDLYIGGRKFEHEVKEDTAHFARLPHDYKAVSEWEHQESMTLADGTVNSWWESGKATKCDQISRKITENKCQREGCDAVEEDSKVIENVPAQGHVFGDWKNVTEEGTFENIEFDKDGNPQLKDKAKDGTYTQKRTCTIDNAVETRVQTIETTVSEKKLEPIPSKNTTWNDKKTEIVLIDHTKPGTYKVNYYKKDKNGNDVIVSSDEKPMEAGHTWNETFVVDRAYKYDGKNTVQSLIDDGTLTVKTDEKTKDEYVVNNDCSKEFTVRYVQECTKKNDKGEAEAINEATAKVVTVKPTGRHNYSKKKGDSVASEDGKTHITSYYNECVDCGAQEELKAEKVDHYDKNGKIAVETKTRNENVVEATCGEEGSYDVVTYCAECGYEFGTEHFTVPATGKHTYGDVTVEADGEYIINGADAVTFTLHQYCKDCGHDKFDEELFTDATAKVSGNTLGTTRQFFTFMEANDKYPGITGAVAPAKLADGSTVYAAVSKVQAAKYECSPATVSVKVISTKSETAPTFDKVGKDDKVIAEFTLDYYKSEAAFYNRTKHVAGTPVTEEREDGTHNVTYCKYGCGTVMSDELVKPEEPEKTLGQVSGLKTDIKDGQVVVSWDALEGADGYLVVAINGKVRGQQIGYTAGTSFVDKDANAKDYNYYWVIPYSKNADGKVVKGELTEKYVWAMKPTTFAANAKSTENGVELTWDAVEGASKYIVKAKAASEKVATELKNVSGTSYVDATASADEYTFYWVFPVYTNAAGKEVVGNASTYAFGMTTK